MSHAPTRVLFVSHSAFRNGASILLLDFLRWLRQQVDWDMRILVRGNGPLVDDFRQVAPTSIWRSGAPVLDLLFGNAPSGARRVAEDVIRSIGMPYGRFDLVYANTCAIAPAIPLLASRASALLWHIHELDYALRATLPEEDNTAAFKVATRFVAVSQQVRQTLGDSYGVARDRVDVVHGFVPSDEATAIERRARRQLTLSRLRWPSDACVIGGCGSLGWRKGSDLFLQIAHSVVSKVGAEKVRFLWVGGDDKSGAALEFDHDVNKLQLQHVCHRVPTTAEVANYFSAFDIFALTSREDPYPLVMLEAAENGLPTVCFAGSGGGTEFVADDAGRVVQYLDTSAFANELIRLGACEELRTRLGLCARQKVLSSHRVETQGPKILSSMLSCLTQQVAAVSPIGMEPIGATPNVRDEA
jgi:glycosyltransferase involved in cell wall biosynthesis